jgi:hypothetical protein
MAIIDINLSETLLYFCIFIVCLVVINMSVKSKKKTSKFPKNKESIFGSWSPDNVVVENIDVSLWEGKDKYVKVLYNMLTKEECKNIINLAESSGFEKALLNIGGGQQQLMTDVRNNDRCIIDSPEIVEVVWQRILQICPNDHILLKVPFANKDLNAVGLNERMRILRYDPGAFFAAHRDGSYVRKLEAGTERKGEQSYVTLQIYLNEGFKGGCTRFMNFDESRGHDVVPKTGAILLFQHDCYHEGSRLLSGRKYALRTDVMYTDKGPGNEYSFRPIVQ